MGAAERIAPGIYLVGGPEISHAEDATSFLIDFDGELVMVDCGAGRSVELILDNVEEEGLDPAMISTLILTHAHIDHIGAAPELRERLGCRILIHEMDADAVEAGDPVRTAADWYGIAFPPTPVDRRLKGGEELLLFRRGDPPLRPHPGPYARLDRRLAGPRRQAGPLWPGHSRALSAGIWLRYRPMARLDGKAP